MTTVTFHSDLLNAPVRVVLDIDSEPMHYQCGTLHGECVVEEVWLYGCEVGSHLSDSAIEVIRDEAEEALMEVV